MGRRETAISCFGVRCEEDPFPDCSILGPLDMDQKENISAGTSGILDEASKVLNELLLKRELHQFVINNLHIFRSSFSAGLPARFVPLRIQLTPNAKPIRVRLQNILAREKRLSRPLRITTCRSRNSQL